MEKSVCVRVSILFVLTLFVAVPGRSQALPDGDGKQLVEVACTRCHGADKFTVERHTHDDWAEEVDVMMRYGTPLDKAQAAQVTDYLTKSFPGKPKPHGVAVAGPVDAVIITELVKSAGTYKQVEAEIGSDRTLAPRLLRIVPRRANGDPQPQDQPAK